MRVVLGAERPPPRGDVSSMTGARPAACIWGGQSTSVQLDPPAANTGKCTVRAVAEIITLWPRQERVSNSWKINGRICVPCMGVLATLC
jgi:hypothetical protein